MKIAPRQPVTPRDILARWLAAAAARMRRQWWLHDIAWAVAGLLVLAVGYATIARLVQPAVVVAALAPLFVLAGIAIPVAVLARRWRRLDLAAAAAAADARAGLRDGLLSAHCFSDEAEGDAFRDLHLQRAAAITRALDLRRLFPLRVPAQAAGTALVALLIAGLISSLPRAAAPTPEPLAVAHLASRASPDNAGSSSMASEPSAREEGKHRSQASLWKQMEALVGELSGSTAGQSLAQAIAARDSRAAAQALQAARQDASKQPTAVRRREAPNEQMTDVLARGILDRLADLLKAEDAVSGTRGPERSDTDRPTASLDRELRAEQEDAQHAAPRQQSEGEDALNTSLRALSRSSTGGRDAVHGEADSAQGAGRASVGGGAMGRRVGVSSAGAGEGDQPGANITPLLDGDPIFGRKTERLAVQLRTVQMAEGDPDDREGREDQRGTEEASYAATRAQAARTGQQAVAAAAQPGTEGVLDIPGSPLEFREAVKRYTLTRHRREREAGHAAGDTQ